MTADMLPMAVPTDCTRCGAPLQFTGNRNPDARLLRRSAVPVGHCASCAMTNFLQHMEPLATVLETKGPEILLDRRVVDQMANILAAGCADAKPQEIDWVSVVINWELPLHRSNPCARCRQHREHLEAAGRSDHPPEEG
jgi:hypothetical protein